MIKTYFVKLLVDYNFIEFDIVAPDFKTATNLGLKEAKKQGKNIELLEVRKKED